MSTLLNYIYNVTKKWSGQKALHFGLMLAILGMLFLPGAAQVQASPDLSYWPIPTFSIVSVNPDSTVTVRTYNFPASENFTVRMGPYGTLALGGTIVNTTNSGAGGSFEETYTIPAGLVGSERIAIRMDSPDGYYAYNWFWNVPVSVVTPIPGYSGIPSFSITSVIQNDSVTVLTNNFPPNQNFTVRMGPYGNLGIGGEVVTTTNSGSGGSFAETYAIPASLTGSQRIAIRMDSPEGYFAYNWFWNNTAGGTGGTGPTPTPGGPTLTPSATPYYGIPTFKITDVLQNDSVTILTNNFPANQSFNVYMNYYGTLGIGGELVATTNSGSGGSFVETYSIPAFLTGQDRIAIRMESPQGYYAFNWFWNNSTGVVATSTPIGATNTPQPSSTPQPSITPGGPTQTPTPTSTPIYIGIPTFKITGVVSNTSVTVLTNNFPANQNFTVTMNYYGTAGVGGQVVATTNSGSGGSFSETYSIPAFLTGQDRIAIRMESPEGYYAFNWFWNNTTP